MMARRALGNELIPMSSGDWRQTHAVRGLAPA